MNVLFKALDQDGPLVARVRCGERVALDALRERHGCALRGFLARRLPVDLADCVAQEIWIACWTNRKRFTGRVRFKSWLYGIATHKITDALLIHEMPVEVTAELSGRSEQSALEQKLLVEGILASLPEVQREVVELHYFAELTLAEIAGALGRNLNAVKHQFYRAHTVAAQCEGQDGDGLQR